MMQKQLLSCITILYLSVGLVHCIWPTLNLHIRSVFYYNHDSIIPSTPFFDRAKPTFFVIHGYDNYGNAPWVVSTKDELLKKLDANVFIVDWSEAATSSLTYPVVVQNVKPCGIKIGTFILQNKIPTNKIHCIGHSLGAHICGFLGKFLNSAGLSLARITGLDPASPGFIGGPETRLDKADASYVDVIHTNTGILGLSTAIGHKDFYPNGGSTQPGCGLFDSTCSHQRSTFFFLESINSNCPFTSSFCGATYSVFSSCNGPNGFMGFSSDRTPNIGTYKLTTNANTPFCRG